MSGTSGPTHRHVGDAVELDLRWVDDTEGDVRAGGNRSRRARRRQMAGGRTSSRSSRGRDEVEHRSPYVPGHLRVGRRCRHAPSCRVRTSGRKRPAGVRPVCPAHHGREVRIRARKPVREDPHEPGNLGVRRSGRCHSGHLPHGPELRPAPSQPEPAERSSAVRADSEGQRLRRRSVRHVRGGVVGGGNGALGSGRQGAERAGVSAARRQVPRSDPRVPGYRAVSGEAAHTGAICDRRRPRRPRTATPP